MTLTWYRHFQRNDFWKMVIYSDECKVELEMDNREGVGTLTVFDGN
jgi:hypothetical protein